MMAQVDEACNHRPNVRAQQMGSQCGRMSGCCPARWMRAWTSRASRTPIARHGRCDQQFSTTPYSSS